MSAKKIKRSYVSIRGNLSSYLTKSLVGYASRWEKKAYLYLEVLQFIFKGKLVSGLEEQPFPISWTAEKKRHYTPDVLLQFYVGLGLKPWLCEIKERKAISKKWDYYKERFRAATSYARKNGKIFKILSDREIKYPNQETLRFLRTHMLNPTSSELAQTVLSALKNIQSIDPSVLASRLSHGPADARIIEEAIWQLAAKGDLFPDLWLPRQSTVVSSELPVIPSVLSKKWLFTMGRDCQRAATHPFDIYIPNRHKQFFGE